MEIAIGVFSSRSRAAEAVRELRRDNVPQESIAFLTRSEVDARLVGQELGAMVGGVVGMGVVAATALLAVPGLGEVIAVGFGASAIVLGALAGSAANRKDRAANDGTSSQPGEDAGSEDAKFFREVLQAGRNLIIVRTESQEIATKATAILDRLGLGIQGAAPQKMRTATREVGDVTIVDVSGRITVGEGNVALREIVRQVLENGRNKILLNLQEVSYVDSSGLGELIKAYTTVQNRGGHLALLDPSKQVRDLLRLTRLASIFKIETDEAGAIQSMSAVKESRTTA
jgi:anti-sigma B factor antagonist